MLFAFASVLLVGLLRADAKRQAGEPFSLTPPFMVGVQAFLAWLLYFYTALALRENVLKVSYKFSFFLQQSCNKPNEPVELAA